MSYEAAAEVVSTAFTMLPEINEAVSTPAAIQALILEDFMIFLSFPYLICSEKSHL